MGSEGGSDIVQIIVTQLGRRCNSGRVSEQLTGRALKCDYEGPLFLSAIGRRGGGVNCGKSTGGRI